MKNIKIIFFSIVFILLLLCSIFLKKPVVTDLAEIILPEEITEKSVIKDLSVKSGNIIKVVFEGNSSEESLDLKSEFLNGVDKTDFETDNINPRELLNVYNISPSNFLSEKTRLLLKDKNYEAVRQRAFEELYNPGGFQITEFDKDPYFLLTDFLKQNMRPDTKKIGNNYYSFVTLRLKNPDENAIEKLIKSVEGKKIYLAGNPVHTYYTKQNTTVAINVICTLSILLFLFLVGYFFKSLKNFLPVVLSIIFGFLSGFVAVKLLFPKFIVLTAVFASVLIGSGIDYSFHYFFAEKHDAEFFKKLTVSMLTTVFAFSFLFLSQTDILKQISVFIIFGLIGIYLFVVFMYPLFSIDKPVRTVNLKVKKRYRAVFSVMLVIIALIGYSHFEIDNNLTAFYTPSEKLKHAETLFNEVSQGSPYTSIITVNFSNFENMLEKEESVTNNLIDNNIDYMCISKIIPSKKKQLENIKLVSNLYKNDADNSGEFLTLEQIKKLKTAKRFPVEFDIQKYPYLQNMILNPNTSIIFVFAKASEINEEVTDINEEFAVFFTKYAKKLLIFFPAALLALFVFPILAYGRKKSVMSAAPPILACLLTLGVLSFFNQSITVFSITALFLIMGFTIDYSIFSSDGKQKSKEAVFISVITTAFPFLALSFTSFKFVSSFSSVLFTGIIISYILGIIFSGEETEQK